MRALPNAFILFDEDISGIELPERFTFPFSYVPHALSVKAAEQLQSIISNKDWGHNFGLEVTSCQNAIGKMFGVLVVQTEDGQLGFLAAYSGKIADEKQHAPFVPPVFDLLDKSGFFKQEEEQISKINRALQELESAPNYLEAQEELTKLEARGKETLRLARERLKIRKMARHEQRQSAMRDGQDLNKLEAALVKQSMDDQFGFKRLSKEWRAKVEDAKTQVKVFTEVISQKKLERKSRSAQLQNRLFDQYEFLNQQQEWKSLLEIFKENNPPVPPAGSGECAAPRLLQYAFEHHLQPISMAEFWWGKSDESEVRKHKQFYPACRGKCEPILSHMLKGLEIEPNPISQSLEGDKELEILFEDEYCVVIQKPTQFLSVPGKEVHDSVYSRMRKKYQNATGPLVVHRLDMSTSGVMLVAKTKEVHKHLQQQFEQRTIKKRYVAVLDGKLKETSGEINLPLRVDFNDRPRQVICFDLGKESITHWELIEIQEGKSRVYFYPKTGRTHQLRVHAAHQLGLNLPIVGDDLYGHRADRLHLHAERLEFTHPVHGNRVLIEAKVPF